MRTNDVLQITTVSKVIQESSNIRSLVFKIARDTDSLPGQFSMVWLPGVGEFPMSFSLSRGKDLSSITVKAMGAGSKILYESKVGDKIGIRGPYGNSFPQSSKKKKRVLLVGGGTGLAPIMVLASGLSENIDSSIIIAARSKKELPFLKEAKQFLGSENVFPTTDDGSLGFKGLAHEKVGEMLDSEKFDAIFSCGPEKMMRAIYDLVQKKKIKNIELQFSMERVMKCGIGICGSCTIGNYVLCKDGPVFNQDVLEKVRAEFGSFERDLTGKLVPK